MRTEIIYKILYSILGSYKMWHKSASYIFDERMRESDTTALIRTSFIMWFCDGFLLTFVEFWGGFCFWFLFLFSLLYENLEYITHFF